MNPFEGPRKQANGNQKVNLFQRTFKIVPRLIYIVFATNSIDLAACNACCGIIREKAILPSRELQDNENEKMVDPFFYPLSA